MDLFMIEYAGTVIGVTRLIRHESIAERSCIQLVQGHILRLGKLVITPLFTGLNPRSAPSTTAEARSAILNIQENFRGGSREGIRQVARALPKRYLGKEDLRPDLPAWNGRDIFASIPNPPK